ncbi:MAG: GDSL-type esterase/lipase family protein [Chthoniobacteraceae bacterium]|nr:GDSL-type esterase/lipase family protein [Chthoniobacteraceae bacterium]
MKYLTLVAACAIAFTTASTASAQNATPTSIMPLGDSLTQADPGYRAPLFNKLTEAGFNVKFVGPKPANPKIPGSTAHAGFGGYTIGPGPSKADAWSGGKGNLFVNIDGWLKIQPDIVLLLIGTNEYFNIGTMQPGYKPDSEGPARLGALLDKIHAVSPKSTILVSSIMPVQWSKTFARGFNAAIPGVIVSRPYAAFVDLNASTKFAVGDWSNDKLHPSDQGYGKMADGWFEALKPVLSAHR